MAFFLLLLALMHNTSTCFCGFVECFYIWREFNKFLYLINNFLLCKKMLFWIFQQIFQGVFPRVLVFVFVIVYLGMKHKIFQANNRRKKIVLNSKRKIMFVQCFFLFFWWVLRNVCHSMEKIICETQKVCSFYSWTLYIFVGKKPRHKYYDIYMYRSVKWSYVLWEQSQDRDPVQWCEKQQ